MFRARSTRSIRGPRARRNLCCRSKPGEKSRMTIQPFGKWSRRLRPFSRIAWGRRGAARGVAAQYYIVPIDQCYKLVGLIRLHWHGLSGGTEVWREVSKFFTSLKERAEICGEVSNA